MGRAEPVVAAIMALCSIGLMVKSAEASTRQSLPIAHGSPSIFFTRPIAGSIMFVAIVLLPLPLIKRIRRGWAGAKAWP